MGTSELSGRGHPLSIPNLKVSQAVWQLIRFLTSDFNPSAAYDRVAVVEDGCLPGRDGPLRFVKRDKDMVGPGHFDHRRRCCESRQPPRP